MNTQASLEDLLTQYYTLCRYCDDFFAATLESFRSHIRCAKGCASCCILETVAPLEAFVIASYVKSSSLDFAAIIANRATSSDKRCIFLHDDECTIYPVRPIICRTHGLPLLYPDRHDVDVCPLNFSDVDLTSVDPKFVLDAESITLNLMRLNLAFCVITQTTEAAGDRISLRWIITGKYNSSQIS